MSLRSPGIKQLGPNLYEIRAQGRSKKTGKKIAAKEKFAGTFREAKARQTAMRADLAARGGGARSRRVTLRTFARSWLESRVQLVQAGRQKPSVVTRYASDLDLHVLPAIGDMFVSAIAPPDVESFLAAARRKDGKPLAANSLRNIIRLLRLLAKAAIAAGLADRDFTLGITAPTPEGYTDENPNLHTPDQLAALLGAVPQRWLSMVVLDAYTGLRWGELSGLRWEDLDLERGLIKVRQSNWRGIMVAPKTKGSKRPVPLPQRFLELEAERLFGKAKPTGLIFTVQQGQRLTRRGKGQGEAKAGSAYRGSPLSKVLTRACADAGVPRITPHGLRRTFNDIGRQVADRLIMKAMVGHTTDAMNEHYTHVRVDELAAAQRAVIERVEGRRALPPARPPEIDAAIAAVTGLRERLANGRLVTGAHDHGCVICCSLIDTSIAPVLDAVEAALTRAAPEGS